MMNEITEPKYIVPAPWTLNGNGIVLLYKFPSAFIEAFGFLDDFQKQGYKAGIGAVILADYKTSGVGPYRELLFLPGILELNGKSGFSISKIYVSTYDSAKSGQRNWGIPKELADFRIEQQEDGAQLWKVKKDGNIFFEASIKPGSLTIPFSSRVMPLTQLIQKGRKHFLFTKLKARGWAKRATLQNIYAHQEYFPPVHQLEPLATLSVRDFIMRFPVAWQLGAMEEQRNSHIDHSSPSR